MISRNIGTSLATRAMRQVLIEDTRAKIEELHRFWFDTGIPLVIDLAG